MAFISGRIGKCRERDGETVPDSVAPGALPCYAGHGINIKRGALSGIGADTQLMQTRSSKDRRKEKPRSRCGRSSRCLPHYEVLILSVADGGFTRPRSLDVTDLSGARGWVDHANLDVLRLCAAYVQRDRALERGTVPQNCAYADDVASTGGKLLACIGNSGIVGDLAGSAPCKCVRGN